jgi:hypothetical protein
METCEQDLRNKVRRFLAAAAVMTAGAVFALGGLASALKADPPQRTARIARR